MSGIGQTAVNTPVRVPRSLRLVPGPRSNSPADHSWLCRQGSGIWNEDRVVINAPVYAVFDGASSLNHDLYDRRSGAWWAAETAAATFMAGSSEPLSQISIRANRAIARSMQCFGIDTDNPLNRWSCSMSACRIRGQQLEWVTVGDTRILLIRTDGSWFPLSPGENHDRTTLRLWKELADAGEKQIFTALRPQIEKVRAQMNRTYGVLNGEEEMNHFLRQGTTSLHGIRHILLFSDGFLPAGSDPDAEADYATIVHHYLNGGLETGYAALRQHEKSDPDCIRFPRFKQHDDASAIAVTLN